MHICYLSLDYPSARSGGGVGTQTQLIGRELVRMGHQVSVIALSYSKSFHKTKDMGVHIYWIPTGGFHWYVYKLPLIGSALALSARELEYSWAAYQQIRQINKVEQIDVVEGTETGTFWCALLLSIPLVIRLHGEQYTYHKYTPDLKLTLGIRVSRQLQRFGIKKAKALTSPSRSHATEISAELKGHHQSITVISNAVTFPNPITCKVQAEKQTQPLVLYVGRLERVKGVPLLLEAAGSIIKAAPEVQFVLAGTNHPNLPQTQIKELLEQYNLNKNVTLLGHVLHDELHEWYMKATVCVIPSYYETFGLTALEAIIHKKPIIAASVGAIPEFVQHSRIGHLINPGDTKALVREILISLKMRKESTDLSEVRVLIDKYSPQNICESLLVIYKQVCVHDK